MIERPASAVAELSDLLRRVHNRLAELIDTTPDDAVSGPSYDDEWTLAQVASHLGSGAEIFGLFVAAGLRGDASPGLDQFQPIWDEWNAKAPVRQARESLDSDAGLLDRVAALTTPEQEAWHLNMFGEDRDLAGLLRMRLSELALHTWDIEVMRNPEAPLDAEVAAVVLDTLPFLVSRAGKGAADLPPVAVHTMDPEQRLLLHVDSGGARLEVAPANLPASAATIAMPAEAFVRLVYGRLDPDHTPATVAADSALLDSLRLAFPGV